MYKHKGRCHCGNISIEVNTTWHPGQFNPRACDCDFCQKHGASYVSDPQGTLRVQVADLEGVRKYRQGNELAEFMLCRHCGVLVFVCYEEDGRLYASVNRRALDRHERFAEEKPVSPAQLNGEQKVLRWKDVWFSKVEIKVDA